MSRSRSRALALAAALLAALAAPGSSARAQHTHPTPADTTRRDTSKTKTARPDSAGHDMAGMDDMADMPGMAAGGTMQGMRMMTPDPLGVTMDRMGSGTTWVPEAAPIPSRFRTLGRWDVTFHGVAFGQYTAQEGTRGARQLGSLNWAMVMASHALAGGRFQARAMLSLDAAGVTGRGYPLLLQTGESYDGAPLHDRQHPHDALMELGILYERPVSRALGVALYAAPSGEPALGPVAFMHRPSAFDNPVAPIGHHWQDATHISFGVLTAGLFGARWRVEGSAFNGQEPDQHRWNLERPRLDSYSGRVTVNPTAHWSFTAGYGAIVEREDGAEHTMHRVTASSLVGAPLGRDGQWSATAVWGANAMPGGAWSQSALLEAEVIADRHNTVFGRAEVVQKSTDDLALDPARYGADGRFGVSALSLGYIRDVARARGATFGLGTMGTLNVVPEALRAAYGARTPLGGMVFVRVRPYRKG